MAPPARPRHDVGRIRHEAGYIVGPIGPIGPIGVGVGVGVDGEAEDIK